MRLRAACVCSLCVSRRKRLGRTLAGSLDPPFPKALFVVNNKWSVFGCVGLTALIRRRFCFFLFLLLPLFLLRCVSSV